MMTRDTAICMLPNTATTSRILSSKDGAAKVYSTSDITDHMTHRNQ